MRRSLKLVIMLTIGVCTCLTLTVYGAKKTLHDPTQPPSYKHKKVSTNNELDKDTNTTAIFCGKNSQFAIINNHIFKVGDKISGATIVAIDISGITLKNDNDGSISKISMSHSVVKTPITKKGKKDRENSD